jgi:stearoyl-CoA desaturase (Delta-9 desaturase)
MEHYEHTREADSNVSVRSNWLTGHQRFHAIWITNLIPAFGFIAAIILAFYWGFGPLEICILASMYILTIIGIEVGFHRLFTHQSFHTHPWVETLLAILGCMGAQGPVIYWTANHRRHHRHSDADGDPHSPFVYNGKKMGKLKGLFHSHVNWQVFHDPPNTAHFAKDLLKNKRLLQVNKYYFLAILLGLMLPAAAGYLIRGTYQGAIIGFLWGGLARIFILNQITFSINSFCHVYGSKPFKTKEGSRNNALLAIPTFGQSWHNNHHAFAYSASVQFKPWQIDLAGMIISLMGKCGLAWGIKKPDKETIENKLQELRHEPA